MKILLLLFVLATCSLYTGCKECESEMSQLTDIPLGCWINAREEQNDPDILIYRPCDFMEEWPLSWYRNRFVLEENGNGSYMVLHPADAHYMSDCTWAYNAEEKTLTFHVNDIQEEIRYLVLNIEPGKIVLAHF